MTGWQPAGAHMTDWLTGWLEGEEASSKQVVFKAGLCPDSDVHVPTPGVEFCGMRSVRSNRLHRDALPTRLVSLTQGLVSLTKELISPTGRGVSLIKELTQADQGADQSD